MCCFVKLFVVVWATWYFWFNSYDNFYLKNVLNVTGFGFVVLVYVLYIHAFVSLCANTCIEARD